MKVAVRQGLAGALGLAGLVVCTATPAAAWSDFNVACENGGNYTLRARAVSDEGDLVTGYLHLAPRRAVHVRLVPMGIGYRYAGPGVWLDGIRETAVLNFSNAEQIPCTVTPLGTVAVRARN